jgi:Flp pilus assembly protein TadD
MPSLETTRRSIVEWLLIALIPIGAFAVYWNAVNSPFFFDDFGEITENPSITKLWPLSVPLSPPANGSGVTGRPIVNLSLALNYAFGGLQVQGYHLFNFSIHALSGLLLFGIVRRTLTRPVFSEAYRRAAFPLALVVALIWTLHPLQTESVTCIAQRTESLMGLFYLLALYAFVRSVAAIEGPGNLAAAPRNWRIVSVAACLIGMATKEVMVTAPLVIWLYDRTFVSGSFSAGWKARRGYYLALAGTWLLLAWVVLYSGGERGGTVSMRGGVTPRQYLLRQCDAITLYLKLSFWPHPLIIDYGYAIRTSLSEVWLEGLGIVTLLAATVLALVRRPVVGFLGASFFLILAPSSSVLPLITQTIAEHRMYLPLAAVMCALVCGLFRWWGRGVFLFAVVAILVCAGLTVRRNHDYRSRVAIWSDTAAKLPDNPRAQYTTVKCLLEEGRVEEGLSFLREAQKRLPPDALSLSNTASVLYGMRKLPEALDLFEQAVRIDPNLPQPRANLCNLLTELGRLPEAVAQGRRATELKPNDASAHHNLGQALRASGQTIEAIAQFQEATRLNPELEQPRLAIAGLLLPTQPVEALQHLAMAMKFHPDSPDVHYQLANALAWLGHPDKAISEYQQVLRLRPNDNAAQARLRALRAAP